MIFEFWRKNQENKFEFAFWRKKSSKLIWNSMFWREKSRKLIWIFDMKIKLIWIISKKLIWICVSTREINLVNIYRLLSIFFQIEIASRQKNLFCILKVKIKEIHLHLCFDSKNPANWFEFWFWRENSNKLIWICVLT